MTLALWVYLEGHQGSRWWTAHQRVGFLDGLKWLAGLFMNAALGVLGLFVAASLA